MTIHSSRDYRNVSAYAQRVALAREIEPLIDWLIAKERAANDNLFFRLCEDEGGFSAAYAKLEALSQYADHREYCEEHNIITKAKPPRLSYTAQWLRFIWKSWFRALSFVALFENRLG